LWKDINMATLEEDMLAQAVPQQMQEPMAQAPVNLRDSLSPLAQDPVDDFMVSLMGVADDLGLVDSITQEESMEDLTDLQDPSADPMQFLSEPQMIELVTKFEQIPEPQRSQLEQQLRSELPPQVSSRLDAVIRFVRQRTQGTS